MPNFDSVQGGREFQTEGILEYFEDLKFTPNADMEQKGVFFKGFTK